MADEEIDVMEHYEKSRTRLLDIWKEFGILEADVNARKIIFSKHLIDFINQIVDEEEQVRKDLIEGIDKKQQELNKLCEDLELPLYQPDVEQRLINKEKDLGGKVKYLLGERKKRLQEVGELMGEDQHLCDLLSATPFYLPRNTTPSNKQIHELKKHIEMLKTQKHQRESLFKRSKPRILNILNRLQISPSSQFENDVIMETDESFIPTTENMNLLQAFVERLEKRLCENKTQSEKLKLCLKDLWLEVAASQSHQEAFLARHGGVKEENIVALQEEVNRCKLLRVQNVEEEACQLQRQLNGIYHKCLVSEEDKKIIEADPEDKHKRKYMGDLKSELNRMRSFFKERQALINLVNKYQHFWNTYLQFEKDASNPDRLFDKGWSLLKEEQERNRMLKELPKTKSEIEDEIKEWQNKTGKLFRVFGALFEDWVAQKWVEFKDQKENEKTVRHQNKQKQLEQERLYGSKASTTPNKRTFTPSKHSASKSRKVLQPSTHTNVPSTHGTPTKQPTLNLHAQAASTTFLLSETIVSSHQLQEAEDGDDDNAPLDKYDCFQTVLNEPVRNNTRSSMAPMAPDHSNALQDYQG